MGARQENLRTALLAPHVVDIGAYTITIFVGFAGDQFVATDDRLAAAEIDDDVTIFDALDGAVDDLADAILVFLILPVALGLAHLLDNDLLGRLGGDTAEIHGRKLLGNEIANLGVRIALSRGGQRNLRGIVLDGLHDLHQPLQLHLACLRVDVSPDVGFLAVPGARRLLNRIRHGGDDDLLVDRLLSRDRIRDLQKFEPVGTDSHFFLPEQGRMERPLKIQFPLRVSWAGSDGSASSPRRFFASLRARLSFDSASRIRSSVRISLASAIASQGTSTVGSSP